MNRKRQREEWRTIVLDDRATKYEVSNRGNVRHIETHRPKPSYRNVRTRRPFIVLYTGPGKKYRTRYLHRVVAEAFIGPRPPGLQTDHIDGDMDNNRVDNLEYVTAVENHRRARARGVYDCQRSGKRLSGKQYDEIMELWRSGVSQVQISKRFGVNNSTVSKIVRGLSTHPNDRDHAKLKKRKVH